MKMLPKDIKVEDIAHFDIWYAIFENIVNST